MTSRKACSKCLRVRAASKFYPMRGARLGLDSICKDCRCAFYEVSRKAEPQRWAEYQERHKKSALASVRRREKRAYLKLATLERRAKKVKLVLSRAKKLEKLLSQAKALFDGP